MGRTGYPVPAGQHEPPEQQSRAGQLCNGQPLDAEAVKRSADGDEDRAACYQEVTGHAIRLGAAAVINDSGPEGAADKCDAP